MNADDLYGYVVIVSAIASIVFVNRIIMKSNIKPIEGWMISAGWTLLCVGNIIRRTA